MIFKSQTFFETPHLVADLILHASGFLHKMPDNSDKQIAILHMLSLEIKNEISDIKSNALIS